MNRYMGGSFTVHAKDFEDWVLVHSLVGSVHEPDFHRP